MARTDDRPASIPEPLSAHELELVPGVLGRIARERRGDYLNGRAPDVGLSSAGEASQRSFASALRAPGLSVIAEIKRASPSQGSIAPLEPAQAARAYRDGGAAALSVLTERRHFGGDLRHIAEVREAVDLPILRKDFTVHPAQLLEARDVGASAVLLIVALCGDRTADYLQFAAALGLDVLVEVHDEEELEVALGAGASIVGVNNRDLRTLEIDLATAPRLLRSARDSGYQGLLVAESGYRTREQLEALEGVADAVLVGTSLAGSGDLTGALRGLIGR